MRALHVLALLLCLSGCSSYDLTVTGATVAFDQAKPARPGLTNAFWLGSGADASTFCAGWCAGTASALALADVPGAVATVEVLGGPREGSVMSRELRESAPLGESHFLALEGRHAETVRGVRITVRAPGYKTIEKVVTCDASFGPKHLDFGFVAVLEPTAMK
jgi:hypothetical protein